MKAIWGGNLCLSRKILCKTINIHYFSLGRKNITTKKQNKKIKIIKSLKGDFFITVKYEGRNISISVLNTDFKIMDKYEIN